MDEGIRQQVRHLSDAERGAIDGMGFLQMATSLSVEIVRKTSRLPTNSNVDKMERIIVGSVDAVSELFNNVTTLKYDNETTAKILSGIFVQSRQMRLTGLGIDVPSGFLANYSSSLYEGLLEHLDNGEDSFFDEHGDEYDLAGYLAENYSADLVEDVQAYIDHARGSNAYRLVRAFEANKKDVAISALGAFMGVLAAKFIIRR